MAGTTTTTRPVSAWNEAIEKEEDTIDRKANKKAALSLSLPVFTDDEQGVCARGAHMYR